MKSSAICRLRLWIAQGFGVGRIPVAPGTFGSLLGLLWTAALLAAGNLLLAVAGLLAGFALSVWLCGAAERQLGARDPGSVVLDEITAMPLAFAGWIVFHLHATGRLPEPRIFLTARGTLIAVAGFAAFRLFDIWKPWPVRQSQALPGGWGVTVDDFLAAVYVNVIWLPAAWQGRLAPS
ncbi:MAG: phosphatidylglycerophosphatase A [Verrucomicrobiota bacterium]